MTRKPIYFDYNATTPVHPEVVEIMNQYFLKNFGNAGSVHEFGLNAHDALDHARNISANFIKAKPIEIIFTSGGSESNNMALQGVLYKQKELHPKTRPHLIIDTIEHPAVWETANFLEKEGFEITRLSVDNEGFVNPKAVEEAIKPNTALISIMYANNEIGTINPIRKIGEIAHKHEVWFHTDAVQAFTKVPIDVKSDNIDLLSVSAHKFYGPKGVGFLYVHNDSDVHKSTASHYLRPLMYGGSQEFNMRPATENVPGIVGMAKAIEIAFKKENERLIKLRDYLINHILKEIPKEIPNTKLNGPITNRLPNNVNICFEGIFAYDLMVELDNVGIAASVGAACHAEETKPSRVLLGIGRSSTEAESSMRFSLGRFSTQENIDILLEFLDRYFADIANHNH